MFLEDFTSSGSLQLVAENINFSLSLSASEFRVPTTFLPKLRDTTDLCRRNFTTMASLYSPSAKLDLLLSTISSLLSSTSSSSTLVPLSVPSFCSLLAYLVVHTGVETLEVEIKLRQNYKCKKCNRRWKPNGCGVFSTHPCWQARVVTTSLSSPPHCT